MADDTRSKEKKISIIQCYIRFWSAWKKNTLAKDGMTFEILLKLIDRYNEDHHFIEEINKQLTLKKIRHANYPSEITENIVKFALLRKYGIMGCWDAESGDLEFNGKRIEVKGFSSDGPCSFGPKEEWNWIYFVDARSAPTREFVVYEVKLSNSAQKWTSLILRIKGNATTVAKNTLKTTGAVCSTGRGGTRPHICFDSIKKQLQEDCRIILSGNIVALSSPML